MWISDLPILSVSFSHTHAKNISGHRTRLLLQSKKTALNSTAAFCHSPEAFVITESCIAAPLAPCSFPKRKLSERCTNIVTPWNASFSPRRRGDRMCRETRAPLSITSFKQSCYLTDLARGSGLAILPARSRTALCSQEMMSTAGRGRPAGGGPPPPEQPVGQQPCSQPPDFSAIVVSVSLRAQASIKHKMWEEKLASRCII